MTHTLRHYLRNIVIGILLLFTCCFSQKQDYTKIDHWLEDHVGDMGGRAVLMIYNDGKIVYSHAVNDMSWRQKNAFKLIAKRQRKEVNLEDFTATTKIPIASCSKWLSAALVMTFVDEGTLSLTDTVGKFLPVLSQHRKGEITIAQALSHTTGIEAPDLRESMDEMKSIGSMDEAIEKIALLPMEGEPGRVFHYSNAGLQIAGAVIEKISGKDFERLFAERIAQPLQMKNTDFGKGKVPLPAGSARSTPEDYMNFLVMILNKGTFNGKRILSERSVAEMQVNRITPDIRIGYSPAESGAAGYGFGEWVMEASNIGNLSKVVSSPGLFGSFPWVDIEKQYCAFLMTMYVKSKGRGERYKKLKELVSSVVK